MKSLLLLFLISVNAKAYDAVSLLDKIPIQSGGRVKPFGTFAKESLRLIHGKSTYNDQDASIVILTFLTAPNEWYDTELIEIVRHDLKENLLLDPQEKYFSLNQVTGSPRLSLLLQELANKIDTQETLDNYMKAIQRLDSQLNTFNGILSGNLITIVPSSGDAWQSIVASEIEIYQTFQKFIHSFFLHINGTVSFEELSKDLDSFILKTRNKNPKAYPDELSIKAELHYNSFHPFRWSYICYLIAAITFLLYFLFKSKTFLITAWSFVVFGFLLNTYGFLLRIYLTGRPPVSNMYESVVWVSWGSVFFSFILEKLKKTNYYVFAASLVGVICLITADIAPVVLDPSLQPLQPVLRSNFWLIVHVMTITLGYSAFFLSFILSDIGLWFFMKEKKKEAYNITQATYRATQIGVVLLIAGTILGGIWADYSWGRFWGWDPKETWALIAILGYIAVLHSRIAGWLRNFGFLILNSLCFLLIIMAWYGVNFVLGAGLHSYGFGGGGIEYVSSFMALQIVYISIALVLNKTKK